MKKFEGYKKAGIFKLADGTEVRGELSLKGAETTLDLYSHSRFDPHVGPDIFGLLYDHSQVSLIDCITVAGRESRTKRNGNLQYLCFFTLFPHYVIFDEYVDSDDRTICGMSFTVDDATTLFYDFDVFGTVIGARPDVERIVKEQEQKLGREIKVGENPELFYYTDKHEIFVSDTVLGQISAMHNPSISFPGPKGIYVDNTISLKVAFKSKKTVEEAIAGVLDILGFLEIIAGRRQNTSKLIFLPEKAADPNKYLNVYWCMPPRREGDESKIPHPADLPIQAAMKPNEFANVLKNWLDRQDAWRNARARFSNSFACQNRYGIDRIVGAANMFDILPQSAYSETITLPADLITARDDARKAFLALPVSPERDSILGALGRIGTSTLKRKIRSRAKIITGIVSNRFPELEKVVDQAVDCRNYYVHGTDAKFDYSKQWAQVNFFTDTLEFVFAASDLVEAGWDISAWAKQGSTLSHPFGEYLFNYAQRLNELKKLL